MCQVLQSKSLPSLCSRAPPPRLCLSFIFKFITPADTAEKVSLKTIAQAKNIMKCRGFTFCLPRAQIDMATFLYLSVFACFDIGIKQQRYFAYAEKVLCYKLQPFPFLNLFVFRVALAHILKLLENCRVHWRQ